MGLVSGGHRNGTHSFLGLAQGCPLFWPVHDHRYNYLALSTDHAVERYVVGPALTLAAAWLVVTMAGGVDVLGPALRTTWHTVQLVVPG